MPVSPNRKKFSCETIIDRRGNSVEVVVRLAKTMRHCIKCGMSWQGSINCPSRGCDGRSDNAK